MFYNKILPCWIDFTVFFCLHTYLIYISDRKVHIVLRGVYSNTTQLNWTQLDSVNNSWLSL